MIARIWSLIAQLWWISSAMLPLDADSSSVHISLTDGRLICGRWLTATVEHLHLEPLAPDEMNHQLSWQRVAAVRFLNRPIECTTNDWVWMAWGDRYPLTVRRWHDDQVTLTAHTSLVQLGSANTLTWGTESVQAVLFDYPASPAVRRDWLQQLASSPGGEDTACFLNGDVWSGQLATIENDDIRWDTAQGQLALDRRRLRWIRLDPELTQQPSWPERWWHLALVDGSRWTLREFYPHAEGWQGQLLEGTTVRGSWSSIVRLVQLSRGCWPVSRRAVLRAECQPWWPQAPVPRWERDRHGDRGVLSVRGEEAWHGLGMWSGCRLTFSVQPGDRAFISHVGIDDVARGGGVVQFRILLDGHIVWTSQQITGRTPLVSTPLIPLTGHQELTLEVLASAAADVADYADWWEPLILRED
ncbi:MAG: hypothetical protein KatS3mg114_0638 [Planctomycetaceae bacterium]|nr:MAG: hypothetical protein KatS3mg114_0638 [Planctomycetaceae bacterium]